MKIDFKKIDEARKLLDLDEKASLQEIKDAYRKMALKPIFCSRTHLSSVYIAQNCSCPIHRAMLNKLSNYKFPLQRMG